MANHRISIVMSAFNGQPYLGPAIESILKQTFRDYELIIVDDGSSDGTWRTILAYAMRDARIVPILNLPNGGVVQALNRGLERAKGAIIVRHDADDLSHPERLQRQLGFLDAHPDYGLVGAVPQLIDECGNALAQKGWDATENDDIQRKLPDYMCLCGPTIMLRRECLKAAGFYFSEGLDASEDYDICLRLAEVTKLASLSGGLYLYRQHPNSASHKRARQQMVNKAIALERAIARRYGQTPPAEMVQLVARDYLHAALIGFAGQEQATAQKDLAQALAFAPALLQKDEPLQTLVQDYTPQHDVTEALAFTAAVFDELLPQTHQLARLKAKLLSRLHMGEVFASTAQPQRGRAKSHLREGIRLDPSWLLNRGVLSIVGRSVLKRDG
jgi:hypothetical protein